MDGVNSSSKEQAHLPQTVMRSSSARRDSTLSNTKSEFDNGPVSVWTSNQRTVQVPQKFLRALGIETPACRSELASDVLILAINWLNSNVRLTEEIHESRGSSSKSAPPFKHSRAIVEKLPDFIIEANNLMLYRSLLQLKQLKNKIRARSSVNSSQQKTSSASESRHERDMNDAIQQLYIGLCALLAFKINITQTREELLEKFSGTSEEVNRVQEDIQLLQCGENRVSPAAETCLQYGNSMDTEGKNSSGLTNIDAPEDQFSTNDGSARVRPVNPYPKSNSLLSWRTDRDGASKVATVATTQKD